MFRRRRSNLSQIHLQGLAGELSRRQAPLSQKPAAGIMADKVRDNRGRIHNPANHSGNIRATPAETRGRAGVVTAGRLLICSSLS